MIKQRKEEILLQQKCEKVDEDNNSIDPSHHNDSSLSHAKKPFMDTLIEEHLKNPSTMTLLDIREEVDTFMFEGKESRFTCHVNYVYIARALTNVHFEMLVCLAACYSHISLSSSLQATIQQHGVLPGHFI